MGLFSKGGNRKSCLGRLLSLVVAIAIIIGVLYLLGILPAGGASETGLDLSGLDITSIVPTLSPDAAEEEAPAPYATKPAHTAPGTAAAPSPTLPARTPGPAIAEDGSYTGKEEVALYIHTYGRLPDNFISKSKAEDMGWVNSEGNLDEVAPGKSIGGSRFGNYEGLLPEKDGRKYYECDINYAGGYRGGERIVYSNDGLVFYTADHYESFEQLY